MSTQKKRKVKARLMYARGVEGLACGWVHVLPADPASYEQMVAQMAKVIRGVIDCGLRDIELSTDAAQTALKSIGLQPARRGKK